ncbi:hypothetical protein EVAR_58796_1 [Eumeta japonica]|uniref:Uncharacterized protein n=1 Tax=Eumeta variegata TaxID=151549 RepID=A0A4C1YMF6_EUMVA|nr:hypothetical protein EVAR_58796_1 [Eumeta japonica]
MAPCLCDFPVWFSEDHGPAPDVSPFSITLKAHSRHQERPVFSPRPGRIYNASALIIIQRVDYLIPVAMEAAKFVVPALSVVWRARPQSDGDLTSFAYDVADPAVAGGAGVRPVVPAAGRRRHQTARLQRRRLQRFNAVVRKDAAVVAAAPAVAVAPAVVAAPAVVDARLDSSAHDRLTRVVAYAASLFVCRPSCCTDRILVELGSQL